ncbi:hypothetical protein Q73A0000_07575 [Kaistella flava (ex Peng et al. 2021)]|uniref:Uncharacterized protein n=1 Tax=Kaistella flava (ex Peng et al. 2021) TaxID=2038776 RepID=A0A7M2Y989_9FLAO|nr:hypothetical protein [Kaistella flava (ex Peng et al. 2021)]QOW10234.1 hypothetical protein Q73A0000_07575 [Kaistella flava (ex Peng et al. 2021)]
MKNSNVKGVLGALAVVGIAMLVKKMADRRKTMKAIFAEYGIKEKTAFGVVDKIRELDKDKYEELKNKFKTQFASKCCKKRCKC